MGGGHSATRVRSRRDPAFNGDLVARAHRAALPQGLIAPRIWQPCGGSVVHLPSASDAPDTPSMPFVMMLSFVLIGMAACAAAVVALLLPMGRAVQVGLTLVLGAGV